jgi:hypothetical protein
MEIVVRTGDAETVVKPETGSPDTMPAGASGAATADAGTASNAGSAPASPGQSGAPPATVAATEPPRATGADQSAGAAPQLG